MKYIQKVINHIIWLTRLNCKRLFNYIMSLYWSLKRKRITAMVRVKNEQEFLLQSICSIIDHVDEVVIIDNNSTDGTGVIIDYLKEKYRNKVKSYEYNHDVAGIGECYRNLQKTDPKSPGLLHNYYNWCLSKCSMPFIMKWDGDMIAMDNFYDYIEIFKKSGYLKFDFGGYNVAADRINSLTLDALIEPRVYPKLFTKFINIGLDCEELSIWVINEKRMLIKEQMYLHTKYCKAVPHANFSPLFSEVFSKKLKIGNKLPEIAVKALDRWSTSIPKCE
jgi:glycosyltransferase involved in cell wall biosynthesis